MKTLPIDLNGTTDLPDGKIAAIVIFLEYLAPPPQQLPVDPALTVVSIPHPEPRWFRALYRRVGEDWLWFSHAVLSDAALTEVIGAPTTQIVALKRGGRDIGLTEIDFAVPGEAEIVSFGVVPDETGSGAAHYLMAHALAAALRPGIQRVWLHTCTHDHPAAVRFYRRAGFVPYKIAVEVADDPRLTGHLRRDAAPHVPIIAP